MAAPNTKGRESMLTVKDDAAQVAQDAATHGYNGRKGKGAQLLKACAAAVRTAARQVEASYAVPAVSADERGEYASELAAWILGDNGGELPAPESIKPAYLIRRARGMILNDRQRRGDWLDPTQPSEPEAGADPRLDGPLSIPAHVAAVAGQLQLSRTAERALIAAMVPATRQEWADLFGYKDGQAFRHSVVLRGRAELKTVGEDRIRRALAAVEDAMRDPMAEIESDLCELMGAAA